MKSTNGNKVPANGRLPVRHWQGQWHTKGEQTDGGRALGRAHFDPPRAILFKRLRLAPAGIVLLALAVCAASRAADLQAKTIDGQVVQGEYLGTENNVVRIRTTYGTVSIPSKDIVTLTAVNLPEKPKPAEGTAPANASVTVVVDEAPNLDELVFKEPPAVNLQTLLAARMPPIPEATRQARQELFRLVRNFGESTDASRSNIVRQLGSFGLMAYPYVDGSYTNPGDIDDKVELAQSVSGPRRPFNAGIFATVHAVALAELGRVATEPPTLPPEVLAQRRTVPTRVQRLRMLARDARTVEGYASISGGPFNALFLLSVYVPRYTGETDALLKDILTDRARLAATATDYKSAASGWTAADRVMLIEKAFPLYFKGNDDVKGLGEDLLKKLLPDKHPKWDAPQGEWFEWWGNAKLKIQNEK
ncbi:MAG TPA: hypothetical protein VKX17_01425 [Planctomycetota bacterium]|nr:hypothetical protein [Planctomycetota bacterium]